MVGLIFLHSVFYFIRLFSKLHSYQSGLCSGSKLWTKLTLNN